MLAPEWGWGDALPVMLVGLFLLYGPGSAILLALRSPAWKIACAAPLVTVAVVGVGGILLEFLGVPWTPATATLWLLVLVAVAWLLHRALGSTVEEPRPHTGGVGYVVGAGLAAILVSTVMVTAGAPGDFPQNPDMIYHLRQTQWFVEHQSASVFDTDLGAGARTFYPAVLHALGATLASVTGAPAVVALTAVQWAFVAVTWPLGVMSLLSAFGAKQVHAQIVGGLLATALPIFPFRLLGYGPLWPLLVALVLVPAWLTLVIRGLPRPGGAPPWATLTLGAVGLLGIGLTHTAAAISLLIAGCLIAADWVRHLDLPRTRRLLLTSVPLAGLAATPLLGLLLAPEGMRVVAGFAGWGPTRATMRAGVLWARGGEGVALGSAQLIALIAAHVLVVLLACVGAWSLARSGSLWLAGAAIVTLALELGVDSFGSAWAPWLTWPWYNDVTRLQAITGLYTVTLAAAGLVSLTTTSRRRRWRLDPLAATAVATALAVISCTTANALLMEYYRGPLDNTWLTSEEADWLRELSDKLPDDAVVVADPWRGGPFLPLVGEADVLIPTEKTSGPELDLLAESLDKVADDPAVCEVLVQRGARYVITGGNAASPWGEGAYPALERVPGAEGFRWIADAGNYSLYEVTACG